MIEKFVDLRSVKKVLKMVKNFSQKFVFHGCGAWYHNGTNKIVRKNGKCICPSYEPFWKKPNDVCNKVETRAQLKLKSVVKNEYVRRYFRFINAFDKNKGYFSSDYDSTDDESMDDESIIPDNKESKTENMNVLTITQSNTGETLVIDENSASNNSNQSDSISTTQNPDNKNETNN